MDFFEISLNDKKYIAIPIELFEKYKHILSSNDEKVDIGECLATKRAMSEGEFYTSDEVNHLLNSKNPIEDFLSFRKIDIETLVKQVNFTKDYILKVARGKRKGSIHFFKEIAKALDVEISYLIQ